MKPEASRSRYGSTRLARLSVAGFTFMFFLLLLRANAAPFFNLDFESSPDFPAGDWNYPFTVYADALPGWTVQIGDSIQDGAFANEFLLDSTAVALMTSSATSYWYPPIEGQKNVFLVSTSDFYMSPPRIDNVGISQVGLVPVGTQYLRFKARNPWYEPGWHNSLPGPFDVRLGGQKIVLVPIHPSKGDVEYVANVSQWAGQTVELSIRVVTPNVGGFSEAWALVDSISFQPGVRLNLAVTSTNTLLLSWPTNAVDNFPFVLHQSPDFRTTSWEAVTNVPSCSSGTNSVTLPLPPAPRYYRLKIVP